MWQHWVTPQKESNKVNTCGGNEDELYSQSETLKFQEKSFEDPRTSSPGPSSGHLYFSPLISSSQFIILDGYGDNSRMVISETDIDIEKQGKSETSKIKCKPNTMHINATDYDSSEYSSAVFDKQKLRLQQFSGPFMLTDLNKQTFSSDSGIYFICVIIIGTFIYFSYSYLSEM